MSLETRRDRPLRTCRPCRRRKVRCDKTHPACSQCLKGKLACDYDYEHPQRVEFQFIAETPGNAGSESGQKQPDLGRSTRNEGLEPNQLIGHLSEQPGRRIRYVEPSFWAYDPTEEETIDNLIGDQTRYEIYDPIEILENQAPGTGTQTSATVSEQGSSRSGNTRSDSMTGLRPNIPYRLAGDLASPPPVWKPSDLTTSRFQRRESTFLLNNLPSRSLCDQLLDFYIKGYHPIAPMIHVQTFEAEYKSLWQPRPPEQAQTQGTSHFVCLLLAVLFAGANVCPDIELLGGLLPGQARSLEALQTFFHEKASKALRKASFPRTPSLETFTSYIILQSTWTREEEPLTTCAFIGVAYRVAQMLGLHRDPSRFSSISPIVAEIRRRIWWRIIHLDILVGLAAGLPPLIDLSTCDVRPASDLKEELIGTPEGLKYEAERTNNSGSRIEQPGPASMVSTAGILINGKYRMLVVIKYVLSTLFGQKAVTRQDIILLRQKIQAVGDDLRSRIRMIPYSPRRTFSDFPFHSRSDLQDGQWQLDSWVKLYMSAIVDRAWIVACHPVLKAPINAIWYDLEPQALEHCRDFIQKATQLSCFEEFRYFQWCWPGIHQPLHAIMTLLHELIKNPQSSASSSFREVLDIAFSLCAPGGGIISAEGRQRPLTEGGSEAWDLLWRLRSRAWRLVGLDPHVLWTREQALQNLYKAYDEAEQESAQVPYTNAPAELVASGFDEGVQVEGISQLQNAELGDLHGPMPMPNVDMSFWDQMVDDQGQMDLDIANYGDFNLDMDND